MKSHKKVLKYILLAIVVVVTLHQVLTYTVPVKLKHLPKITNYEIVSPYNEHPIGDDDIEVLVSYLEKNKFRRIRPPVGAYHGNETIFIDLQPTAGPYSIYLCYTVYYPPFSYLQYDFMYYRLDKEDREFLYELVFGDEE